MKPISDQCCTVYREVLKSNKHHAAQAIVIDELVEGQTVVCGLPSTCTVNPNCSTCEAMRLLSVGAIKESPVVAISGFF